MNYACDIPTAMASILSRKRDLIYLVYFLIHIPVMFCVDLVPLYPTSLRPAFLSDLRTWYIATYRDPFFVSPPAWFTLFTWLELLYHVPVSVYAIGALLRDDSTLPVHLLIYAMETAMTTATCIAEYLSFDTIDAAAKVELSKLYVPYLAVAVFMGVDMYARLSHVLAKGQSVVEQKKRA